MFMTQVTFMVQVMLENYQMPEASQPDTMLDSKKSKFPHFLN